MVKRVILVVAAVLVLAGVGGCGELGNVLNLRRPTASLQGVGFDSITLESAQLLFDVEIENPYSAALPLVNLDYRLMSRGCCRCSDSL